MKSVGEEEDLHLMLNNSVELLKERLMSKMDIKVEPVPSKVIPTLSPNKLDSIAELENVIRLIRRGYAKERKNSKGNDSKNSLKTLENGPKNNNNYPVDPLAIPTPPVNSGKGKGSEGGNSDMVEVLRQMLDKALQALKICQNKINEANKKQEASKLEIQKLQDEVRNLRAQINPPQLQLMKGISSLASGNKRRRLRSPSSSGSSSRSSSSSRQHSSRRSESPPQLSPAFIPRPVSSMQIGNTKKRDRYSSPHSFGSDESNSMSNIFNHDSQLEDAQFPDSGRTAHFSHSGSTSKNPNLSQEGAKQGFKNLKSNMKNTSHLWNVDSKQSNSVKGKSSSLYSFKKTSQGPMGGPQNQSLLTTVPCTSSSSGVMKFNKNKTPVRTYGNTRSSSASRVHEGTSLISDPPKPNAPSSKSNSGFTGKITRNVGKLSDPEPPVLENHAESDSEEEFDAFTFAKNDDEDESEELIDIDELPEIPPPSLPPPKSAQRKNSGLLTNFHGTSPSNSSFKFSSTHGAHSSGSESLKMPDIRSSASMPSSPISSVTSSKIGRKRSKSTAGLRKFRSSTLNSRAASSIHAATTKLLKNRSKLRENRHSYPMVRKFGDGQEPTPSQVTISPFPPRQFDRKIDYSSYLNGKFPVDSNTIDTSVVSPDHDGEVVIKEEKDIPSTSKSVTTRKGIREVLERFAMRLDESENCMMAQIPYQFYESETKFDPVDCDEDGFKSEKKDASLVEIPRWRERIFQPYDPSESPTDESLDDQVFLKRHTKSEINERRRKRWDSQRMREESYLEKLKRKREERENQKKYKRRRGRNQQNDKTSKDDDIFTFQPLIHEAVYIRNDPELPVTVFGYPLPIIESEEFELPWTVPAKPPKSPKKPSELNKIQAPVNKISGLKTALRQSKR